MNDATYMSKLIISSSYFQASVVDLLPCNNNSRARTTHALLEAYNILEHFDIVNEEPYCTRNDLLKFHSSDYLDVILDPELNSNENVITDEFENWDDIAEMMSSSLKNNHKSTSNKHYSTITEVWKAYKNILNSNDNINIGGKRKRWEAILDDLSSSDEDVDSSVYESGKDNTENNIIAEEQDIKQDSKCFDKYEIPFLKKFNLIGDCPLFHYLPMYCYTVGGATLSLLDQMNPLGPQVIGINWDGGRHHANKRKGSGFCYVNDIVLAIQKLREKGFKKISYIDFDLHHGDGVERAFKFSKNVQTISVHMYEPGFFPCTGSLEETRTGIDIVNIPVLHGLDDNYLKSLVDKVIIPSLARFTPECLVIQCGGDGLIGDKYKEWGLTISGLTNSILSIIDTFSTKSVLFLGGGGYNPTLMARFHTFLTSKIVSKYSNNETLPYDVLELKNNTSSRTDTLIPDHCFSELYNEEFSQFWFYELPGSPGFKQLYNDNKPECIDIIKGFYGL